MIKLDNVSKIYRVGTFGGKQLHAVNNVSFELKEGEIVSLIGESGSGKTTIGKMILGLISISSGTITSDGVDISTLNGDDLKTYYRQVQGVFQDPFSSYNPIFKVDRIFDIVRAEYYPDVEVKDWKEKLDNSLHDVGLNPKHVLNKFPHQLSGGQLQRLLIARALLLDIHVLIADEIISMLDASTRIDVLNLLKELSTERGLAILFITHDLSLGYYISQRSVILHRGVMVEMGATQKIYQNPLHPYTKMLMASVPRIDQKWEKVEADMKKQRKKSPLGEGLAFYEREYSFERNSDMPVAPHKLLEVEPEHFVAVVADGIS
jgi:peptide/nickel transport system ATP-binding protein